MNYTGRPSISGCRPVLSLYPTHCFCQYLLRIFITFTNSSLFTRAFSTNSRRALSHAAGVTAAGCALSGASRQLPQRGRSSTSPSALTRCHLPYRGEALAFRKVFLLSSKFSSSPEAPLLGELSAKQTERLYEGEPFLCRKIRLAASFPVSFWRKEWYNGFAALPAHFIREGGESNELYSIFCSVCRSKCNVVLHLQVA